MQFLPSSRYSFPPCSAILLGWSDPVGNFGHSTVPKSGVAPAQHGVLRASKSKAAPCATLMLPSSSRHPLVTRTVTQRVTCLVCSSVTAPNYLKVATVEGRSPEHRKPVDGIADGWNGSCFEQAAGMCSDEVERMDLHIGGTKGSESVKMVCRNHS